MQAQKQKQTRLVRSLIAQWYGITTYGVGEPQEVTTYKTGSHDVVVYRVEVNHDKRTSSICNYHILDDGIYYVDPIEYR